MSDPKQEQKQNKEILIDALEGLDGDLILKNAPGARKKRIKAITIQPKLKKKNMEKKKK